MENIFVNNILDAGLDAIGQMLEEGEITSETFPDDNFSYEQFINDINNITDEELAEYERNRRHFAQKIA